MVSPSRRSGRDSRGLIIGLRSEVGSRSTVIDTSLKKDRRRDAGGPATFAFAQGGQATQFLISLVTGRLPRGPPADQPPIMPENIPASPPARAIKRPPGRNLLTVLPASDGGPPSAIPLAPAIRSSPGISHKRYSSSWSRAFDQPAFRNVRWCSGQTTSSASQDGASLTLWIAFNDSAMLRARLSGSRDFWSRTPCKPKPANRVTAEAPGFSPRSTESGSQHEPSSSSAKQ